MRDCISTHGIPEVPSHPPQRQSRSMQATLSLKPKETPAMHAYPITAQSLPIGINNTISPPRTTTTPSLPSLPTPTLKKIDMGIAQRGRGNHHAMGMERRGRDGRAAGRGAARHDLLTEEGGVRLEGGELVPVGVVDFDRVALCAAVG